MNVVQGKISQIDARVSAGDRRAHQRERLIDCAEQLISTEGLAALRARDLAKTMGCAVGAIYNLVADLDDLVLLVARRTNHQLGAYLDAASTKTDPDKDTDTLLAAWAQAYFRYARDNRKRWRALFEFRMPEGSPLPAWFEADQADLFHRLEERLAPLMPHLDPAERQIKARVLFSAIHGVVALALEDKFTSMPVGRVESELDIFVRAYLRGISPYTNPG